MLSTRVPACASVQRQAEVWDSVSAEPLARTKLSLYGMAATPWVWKVVAMTTSLPSKDSSSMARHSPRVAAQRCVCMHHAGPSI